MAWDAGNGTSLYQVLQQQMMEKQRHSEDSILRSLVDAEGKERGSPDSLLYYHAATAEVRQKEDATLSLLHVASWSGLARVCARLLVEGLDVDERTGRGES